MQVCPDRESNPDLKHARRMFYHYATVAVLTIRDTSKNKRCGYQQPRYVELHRNPRKKEGQIFLLNFFPPKNTRFFHQVLGERFSSIHQV